jgi:hypothetical protein
MFFKKKQPLEPQTPANDTGSKAEWDLPTVARALGQLTPALETREIEPLLIQARLADHYRDIGLEPLSPSKFDTLVQCLDAESWRRFALAIGPLDHVEIRSVLKNVKTSVLQQVQAGFVAVARQTSLLTISLLRQSDIRTEEFARHLAAFLGVGWRGETSEQSKKRLHQLDYKRLLAEAEEAKKQAEERMEYLRKKQEEDSARRRPRGKQ